MMKRRDFLKGGVIASGIGISAATQASTASNSDQSEAAAGEKAGEEKTYTLQRSIPLEEGYDFVVSGGGPAGVAAAVCAARLGAKVLLAEATGWLGGMGTSGFVNTFDPMANGEQMLVGGFMREVVDTMYERGFLGPGQTPSVYGKRYHHWTPFKIEGYKLLLDEFVTAANVEVRFFTRVIECDSDPKNGVVNGIVLSNVEGCRYIRAKAFADCTGDAVLADLAGAACREAGRDTRFPMASTLPSLFANIDFSRMGNQSEALERAIGEGHFSQPDKHLPGMSRVQGTVGYLNGGHIFKLNSLCCKSLSEGMMFGRRLAQEYKEFYKKYVPGCENIEHVTTAPLMGVRESRRIVGEYELNFDDYRDRRTFPDQIAIFNKSVDIHAYEATEDAYQEYLAEFTKTGRHKPGEYFGIPYSILVPKGWKNLWVAGRCNSSDVQVHGSIRVQPACSMMGQAIGAAAIQSIRTGQPANDLDTEQLVLALREAKANLPQEKLSKEMTRS